MYITREMLTAITKKSQWYNRDLFHAPVTVHSRLVQWVVVLMCSTYSFRDPLPIWWCCHFHHATPKVLEGMGAHGSLNGPSHQHEQTNLPNIPATGWKSMFPGREKKHTYWHSTTQGIASKWLKTERRECIVPCTLPAQGLFSLNHLNLWSNLTKTDSKGGFHISSWQSVT